MAHIILFILASVGMTHILVDGSIFHKIRIWVSNQPSLSWLASLFECYQCSGFWCGLFVGLVVFGISFNIQGLLMFLVYGCAGSFLSMWAAGHLGYLDSLTNIDLDDLNNE